ncbi:MAG: DNA translocase FtsK [Dehalococcoidia bacterium]|nr:DNA translocase FtsK [Dehalococcoidia bacterium]
MGKGKTRKRSGQSMKSVSIWRYQWMALRTVVIACVIVLIAFFRSFISNLIFETIGLALVLWAIWVIVFIILFWRHKWNACRKHWNVWLGALVFTFAAWGILSVIHHAGFVIGDVRFEQVSLGGETGKYLIGNQGVGLIPEVRLALLICSGIALIAPHASLAFLKFAARCTGAALVAMYHTSRTVLAALKHKLVGFSQAHPPQQLLGQMAGAIQKKMAALFEKKRPETAASTPLERSRGPDGQLRLPIEQRPSQPLSIVREVEEKAPREIPGRKTPELAQLPPIQILDKVAEVQLTEADNLERAKLIENALESYGVEARVVQISPGPSVTQFGIEPGWDRKFKRIVERDERGKTRLEKDGNPIERTEEISKTRVKVERITALANNLALTLASPSIRIEAPVPGKSVVGIEVPNTTTSLVQLRAVIESQAFQRMRAKSSLALALGKGSAGEAFAADLSKMPHLLIAGETGSGKTVCINAIITCLLMHNLSWGLRLLLIDPKRVELVSFAGVPHLISPIVVEMDKAVDALRRAIREMEHRYTRFAAVGARNIDGYNRSPLITEPMPYLVIIVDELAHLMMSAAEVVEPSICRLAQLSRATGIHLIIATQRPSVDVVTGLIKANFPTRIAFAVSSIVDSRTILDTGGAEKLLGKGDMLYMPPDAAKPKRLRGCFASDPEIDRVVSFWVQHPGTQTEADTVARAFAAIPAEESRDEDPMLVTARRLAKDTSHLSTSLLQRRLHIGYPRAARIMDTLEQEGMIRRTEPDSPAEVVGAHEEEVE